MGNIPVYRKYPSALTFESGPQGTFATRPAGRVCPETASCSGVEREHILYRGNIFDICYALKLNHAQVLKENTFYVERRYPVYSTHSNCIMLKCQRCKEKNVGTEKKYGMF
jgi:hypothetical protein